MKDGAVGPGRLGLLALLGPGLAMAAFGVGAGDTTTTALAGARYGLALIWVPLVASIFKSALNEGLARWQLATGQTLVEGWATRMGPLVRYGFLVYFLGWSIPAFGSLIAVSGLAAEMIWPLERVAPALEGPLFPDGPQAASVAWSVILVILGALIVGLGRYELFERVMSILAVGMVAITAGAAVTLWPSADRWRAMSEAPWLPPGSITLTMAVLGGMGPTVGILAYSYWMRERRREGASWLTVTRVDVAVSYLATGLFGVSMIALTGGLTPEAIRKAIGLAADAPIADLKLGQVFALVRERLTTETGLAESVGAWLGFAFGLSLWATVVSSLLGMLQSMPYLCVDYLTLLLGWKADRRARALKQESLMYRVFLGLVALGPIPLVAWKRPTTIVLIYGVWGSLFIPFLAATLLVMNNRREWVGNLRSGWLANTILVVAMAVFLIAIVRVLTDPEALRFAG